MDVIQEQEEEKYETMVKNRKKQDENTKRVNFVSDFIQRDIQYTLKDVEQQ